MKPRNAHISEILSSSHGILGAIPIARQTAPLHSQRRNRSPDQQADQQASEGMGSEHREAIEGNAFEHYVAQERMVPN
jgi:negative regulator of sigma E activity